jgi:cyanophycinase
MAKKARSVTKPGTLMLIGGAEDKFEQKFLLKTFFERSGGPGARLTILPSASELADSGTIYHQIFTDFGARHVRVLPLFNREEANLSEVARELATSKGIFLTGGDQSKIVRILQDTASHRAILAAYERGAVISGTSAGAAAMSNPMIVSGLVGSLARSGMVKLGQGLGLTEKLLIDQHFHQRNRLGRLLTAVMSYPHMLGIGVDEDTAAIVRPDGALSVIGRGTVTIVDPSGLKSVNLATAPDKSALPFSHMVLHTLTHGGCFDLNKKTIIPEE